MRKRSLGLMNRWFAALLSVALLGSCSDEMPYEGPHANSDECEIVDMCISVSAADLERGLDSRSVDDTNVDEGSADINTVKDVWILQYDANGKKSAEPFYVDDPVQLSESFSVPVVRPKVGTTNYKLIAIANTHDSSLQTMFSGFLNTTMLRDWQKIFTSEESGYNAPSTDGAKGDLLLNGWQEITSTSDHIDVTLYRTMAKVTVKVTIAEGSGIKLSSLQMKNVRSKFIVADKYVTSDPKLSQADEGHIDLPKDNWVTGNQSMDFVYYLPRNMCGDVDGDNEKTKNYNAPLGATYVEIKGNSSAGDPMLLRFYLGKNMTNNFDLEPNYHYVLPIEIKSVNNINADSRVDIIRGKEFKDANSFIINLFLDESVLQAKYTVPIERINKYWDSGQTGADATYALSSTDKWRAEVVWQDCGDTDMFHFVNSDGTELASGNPHFYEGTGGDLHFYIRPTGRTCGNALIGVHKKTDDKSLDKDGDGYIDGYSWSWHLWFTDYTPDGKITTATDDGLISNVLGGCLYRYNTEYWKNHTDSYMMDRNFGALYKDYNEIVPQATDPLNFGLYYQCGRKEPIPARKDLNTTLSPVKKYILDGGSEKIDAVEFTRLARAGSLKEAIHYPTVFYYNGEISWCIEDTDGKTTWDALFDPSPEGWCFPDDADPYMYGGTLKLEKNVDNKFRIFKFQNNGHTITFSLGYPSITGGNNIAAISGGQGNVYLSLKGLIKTGTDKNRKKIAKQNSPGQSDFYESKWIIGDLMPIRLIKAPSSTAQ